MKASARRIDEAEAELSRLQNLADEFEIQNPSSTTDKAAASAGQKADEARRAVVEIEALREDIRRGRVPRTISAGIVGLKRWADLQTQRNGLAEQVEQLSRTLLDGHPRMAMARLRLADLDEELAAAREALERALDQRLDTSRADIAGATAELGRTKDIAERRDALHAQSDEAKSALEVEKRLHAELIEAVAGSKVEALPRPVPMATASAPAPLSVEELPETQNRPPVWPIVAGASALGLFGSAGFVAVGSLRRRRYVAPQVIAAPSTEPERSPAGPASHGPLSDVVSIDDVIGAVIASEIPRSVIIALGSSLERPLATEISRRLALRGHSVALVDLSADQRSAQAMGAPPDSSGMAELATGQLTFAEVARRDFATQADVFSIGRQASGFKEQPVDWTSAIEFVERNYETIIVDCGVLSEKTVDGAVTGDAALLLAVGSSSFDAVETGVAQLRSRGIDDVIIVGEG